LAPHRYVLQSRAWVLAVQMWPTGLRHPDGRSARVESLSARVVCRSRLIADLVGTDWDDEPNDYFPPTSFQVSDINAGTGATNVVPGTTAFRCNWRFSTSTTAERIEAMVEQLIDTLGMEASIEWNLSGEPFLTTHGTLTSATAKVIKAQTGIETDLSTGGGTSDGRFIAKLGCELIELGPINRSIHKIDEEVKIDDLPRLKDLYKGLMTELIG
jgi:succinyl-diaminopimelate desuccinylase